MAKRFKWRLDTVKKAKERHEDQKKQAFGEAQSEQNSEERVLAELQQQRKTQQDRLQSSQSGKLNALDLQTAHAFISNLAEKIAAQQLKVDAARQITEGRRSELVKAVQENKVLENLRERDHASYKKDERKREQAETDETANRAAHRRAQQEESES
jgi:flagellar export protein FliJ